HVKDDELSFRWNNCVQGFNMPLKIYVSGEEMIIKPTARFTTVKLPAGSRTITVDPNFYVALLNMTGK
ncbi:MAG TPA: hypothetical protein VK861_03995, partial [Bacteroidales bacterium]|nr:hypothetical protein [Bacteroidales bacterium]